MSDVHTTKLQRCRTSEVRHQTQEQNSIHQNNGILENPAITKAANKIEIKIPTG